MLPEKSEEILSDIYPKQHNVVTLLNSQFVDT